MACGKHERCSARKFALPASCGTQPLHLSGLDGGVRLAHKLRKRRPLRWWSDRLSGPLTARSRMWRAAVRHPEVVLATAGDGTGAGKAKGQGTFGVSDEWH